MTQSEKAVLETVLGINRDIENFSHIERLNAFQSLEDKGLVNFLGKPTYDAYMMYE